MPVKFIAQERYVHYLNNQFTLGGSFNTSIEY